MARAPIPASKANDILDELRYYFKNPFKKIDKSSLKWQRIRKDINDLKKVSYVGYLLQACLYAMDHDLRSMENCFGIVNNNGRHPTLSFYRINCYFYNGLFHKTLNELKLLQSDISKLSMISSTQYINFLTEFGMDKTLDLFLKQLEKLNIKIDNQAISMDNQKVVLEHFNEDIYSPVLAEAYTYLFQNKVGLTTYKYEYDEEQQAIFIELFITFYNENGNEIELSEKDFIDFDIKFQKYWINYAAQKNLDTDNLILSLTPLGYLSDSEISELRGQL